MKHLTVSAVACLASVLLFASPALADPPVEPTPVPVAGEPTAAPVATAPVAGEPAAAPVAGEPGAPEPEAVPVPLHQSGPNAPGLVQKGGAISCVAGLNAAEFDLTKSAEVPLYEGLAASITATSKTSATVRYVGTLPPVLGVYVRLGTVTVAGDVVSFVERPSTWLPGMEKALSVSTFNFTRPEGRSAVGLYSVVLCVDLNAPAPASPPAA